MWAATEFSDTGPLLKSGDYCRFWMDVTDFRATSSVVRCHFGGGNQVAGHGPGRLKVTAHGKPKIWKPQAAPVRIPLPVNDDLPGLYGKGQSQL